MNNNRCRNKVLGQLFGFRSLSSSVRITVPSLGVLGEGEFLLLVMIYITRRRVVFVPLYVSCYRSLLALLSHRLSIIRLYTLRGSCPTFPQPGEVA